MNGEESKKPEAAIVVGDFNPDDHPEIPASALELHHVYILQGQRVIATFNYAGQQFARNPLTGLPLLCHCFDGPRGDVRVALIAYEDGTLHDAEGNKIILRKYTGTDV